MAKKDETLRGGLNTLFNGNDNRRTKLLNTIEDEELKEMLINRKTKPGRPRKAVELQSRTSVVMSNDKHQKLRNIAARENLTIKEIIELAISWAIERYEAKHGVITPTEKKKIEDIF